MCKIRLSREKQAAAGENRLAGAASGRSMKRGARAVAGVDSTFEGCVSGDNDLRIQGEVNGPVNAPGSVLYVEATGRVKGRVVVRRAVIAGTVTGDVEASELVTVMAGARVSGSLTCPRVVVEDGAALEAAMNVGQSSHDPVPSMEREALPGLPGGTA